MCNDNMYVWCVGIDVIIFTSCLLFCFRDGDKVVELQGKLLLEDKVRCQH